MPWHRKERKEMTEQERLIGVVGTGEWKMGMVSKLLYNRLERHHFMVPVPMEKLGEASYTAASMLAKLPAKYSEQLELKVIIRDSTMEGRYGEGMCALVIIERRHHDLIYPRDHELIRHLGEIGSSLVGTYTPDNIKEAYRLLLLRRGSATATDY